VTVMLSVVISEMGQLRSLLDMMMMMVTHVFGLSRHLAVSHLLCSNSAKLQCLKLCWCVVWVQLCCRTGSQHITGVGPSRNPRSPLVFRIRAGIRLSVRVTVSVEVVGLVLKIVQK